MTSVFLNKINLIMLFENLGTQWPHASLIWTTHLKFN